ncbi:MAG: hypothetical protein KGH98_01430 [Candidatus Micrarchaeota archaeon]|nr:hypothetical protein [Candidatus Micrarchaeota archaeon]
MENQTAYKYGFWVSLIGAIALVVISALGLASVLYLAGGGFSAALNATTNSTIANQIAQLKSEAPIFEANFAISAVAGIVIAVAAIVMNRTKSRIRKWFTVILVVSVIALLFGGTLLAIIPLIGGIIGMMYKEESQPQQAEAAPVQHDHRAARKKGHRG